MLNILRDVSQETGEEFYNRLHPRPRLRTLSPLLPHVDLRPRDVVELAGGEGEGKSTFLAHLVCRTILPRTAGGHGLGAIFIDLNLNVGVADIRDMLSSMLDDDDAKDLVVSSSLSRLTVLHAHDPGAFGEAAARLPSLLEGDRRISLVAVDALGAFFYVERAKKDVGFFDAYVKTQLKAIRQRIKAFDVVVAFAKQDLFRATTVHEEEERRKRQKRIYPGVGLQVTIGRGKSMGGGDSDDHRLIAVERCQDGGSKSFYKFVVPRFGCGEATLMKKEEDREENRC